MTKRALCVGINDYPGSELRGCVNDATDWAGRLSGYGYDVQTLLDWAATGAVIVEELVSLVTRSRFGDRIVFTFSGHGTHYADRNADEADRRDEAICPADVFTLGSVLDDTLAAIFAARRVGVRATMVSDSCHSGTVTRFLDTGARGKPRFMPPSLITPPPQAFDLPSAPRLAAAVPSQPVMLLSGCKDDEYSYDAEDENGRPCGAFSNAAMRALRGEPDPTWTRLHQGVRVLLPSTSYPQTPLYEATAWQRRWKIR